MRQALQLPPSACKQPTAVPSPHCRTSPSSPAVYLSLKSLVCCRGLDAVGAAWLALLLSASAGVALCLFACSVLAALDKLGKLKG